MAYSLTTDDRQWLTDYIHDVIRWGTTTPSVSPVASPSLALNERKLTNIDTLITQELIVKLDRIESKIDQLLAR